MSLIHEPYKSKDFTIDDVIADNLKLRQRANEIEKDYHHIKNKHESTQKRLNDLKRDYDELLKDYIKLKQENQDLEYELENRHNTRDNY
jgi:predicted  nucleic acid-binding Zn-ribbon protein